jgi:hypothetical protein
MDCSALDLSGISYYLEYKTAEQTDEETPCSIVDAEDDLVDYCK